MAIRVFISHKREDFVVAAGIYLQIEKFGSQVSAYLDELDERLDGTATELTAYLRDQISSCTHLIAVLSRRTKESWWVPFEIGIATEKDYPLSRLTQWTRRRYPTFSENGHNMTTEADVDSYLKAALDTHPEILRKGLRAAGTVERRSYAQDFHSRLKARLGQR
jgi:hypothetical protein